MPYGTRAREAGISARGLGAVAAEGEPEYGAFSQLAAAADAASHGLGEAFHDGEAEAV